MGKFVENIIAFSLRHHVFILVLTCLLFVSGLVAYYHTPIEAYPDVTNTRVRVITQWRGRSSEELEKFVTLPVTQALNSIPNKASVRSISLLGLSVVTVIFEDGVDDFFAQQYAAARLQSVILPEGADLSIEPPSGGTGEIFRYVLRSDLPIRELYAINDWVVRRELFTVPGIADVVTFGGEEKIFEIRVNPIQAQFYDLSPLQIYDAVSKSNVNVGGDVLQKGEQTYVVKGIGLLQSIEDVENILIELKGTAPIKIKNVATVSVSAKPRQGQVGLNDQDDLVEGIIIMLRGENPSEVIKHVKIKLDELNNRILPKEVKIEPFMDRTTLVNHTVDTVVRNMIEGMCLVAFIVLLFLYNWRAVVIVASLLPLSFLFAIIMLRIQGLPANLISMGSLDFGLILDITVIVVETVFVALLAKSQTLGDKYTKLARGSIIKKSASSVATSIFFAQVILALALMPIFSFEKVEGKMFSPLAFTLAYALCGALLLSLTYVPVMCKILFVKPLKEKSSKVAKFLIYILYAFYKKASAYRWQTVAIFLIILVVCFVRFSFWGTEFIPGMNEGAVGVRVTLPNSINLDEAVRVTKDIKKKLQALDEVDFILTQTGRPNDGTDPTGFFNIEIHVELKPAKKWKKKRPKDDVVTEIQDILSAVPGVEFALGQPIQDNVSEYVAGVKSTLVVKIFGNDLEKMEGLANQTANIIKDVKGIKDVTVFRSMGLPELIIKFKEEKMAQYAVAMQDAQAVIEMAIGGKTATYFYENERIFDVMVRFGEEFRSNENKIGDILVPTLTGQNVPVREIAEINFVNGPAFIYREGSSRYIGVGFSIRERDLGTTIHEAQQKVEKELKIDAENKLEWAGEFESQQRAIKRLTIIVPSALLLIIFLLYMHFRSTRDTLLAVSTMFYAFIGGFISLWITDTTFGISAGIGFIILFGVVCIDNILLITGMKKHLQLSGDIEKAIEETVRWRIRPVLMIALMGALGLLPAALSDGMGSEVQKPLAIMIVGGILTCMILSFTVLPQIFYFTYRNSKLNSKDSSRKLKM